jgi:hypothetical protein
VFRLKAPLVAADGARLPLTARRRLVRSEADGLLTELGHRLAALPIAQLAAKEQTDV